MQKKTKFADLIVSVTDNTYISYQQQENQTLGYFSEGEWEGSGMGALTMSDEEVQK